MSPSYNTTDGIPNCQFEEQRGDTYVTFRIGRLRHTASQTQDFGCMKTSTHLRVHLTFRNWRMC